MRCCGECGVNAVLVKAVLMKAALVKAAKVKAAKVKAAKVALVIAALLSDGAAKLTTSLTSLRTGPGNEICEQDIQEHRLWS